MTDISLKTMLYAIDEIVWYNGLGEKLLEVLKDLDKAIADGKTQYIYPEHIFDYDNPPGDLQAVWMTCVTQFGNWGTSPRYGWIDDLKGCRAYLLAVTYTYRHADLYLENLYDSPLDVWKREAKE